VTERGSDSLSTSIPLERIPLAFCAHLPTEISVYGAAFVPEDFHPRYGVERKEYIYRIYTARTPSPFETGRSYHYSRPLLPNSVELMDKAARLFEGRHDFTAFMAQGSKIVDAERRVYSASVERDPSDPNIIIFRVSADGFLYNMVRIMTGTLLSVGSGNISPEYIFEIIESKNRSMAGETAPPEGLYLNRVIYPTDYFNVV
jgi:tRNA pseudouridine38-40 synthase